MRKAAIEARMTQIRAELMPGLGLFLALAQVADAESFS